METSKHYLFRLGQALPWFHRHLGHRHSLHQNLLYSIKKNQVVIFDPLTQTNKIMSLNATGRIVPPTFTDSRRNRNFPDLKDKYLSETDRKIVGCADLE